MENKKLSQWLFTLNTAIVYAPMFQN